MFLYVQVNMLAAGDGFETFLLTYFGSLKYYKQMCEIWKR
jgi:hypothetical protein